MTTDLRRPTATDPWIIRASDGAAIYNLPDKAQLPAALDTGALKVKEQAPLTEISLSAATLAALETVNAVISDGGATISIDDGAASITVDGSVALDAGTLAALETINAVVSGTVALDSTALAALETIELGGTSLAALESITVVGALTDAELRASPVPVSGTVSTGGLTDTQLRATPVSVEQATSVDVADGGGSLTVDGPATDAQLRATPLPVSGTVTTAGLTDTQLRATPVPISVDAAALAALETTELGATTLAALETINAVISDGGGTITVDDGAASLTVDGTVALDATTLAALETVNAVISGEVALDAPSLAALETIELGATSLAALESITATGPLTDTQLRATPVPISGTVSTGGLTDTQLRATPVSVEQATSVDVADGGGSLTVDSPQLPSALATDRLKVDGSGVTQPVSGTVTANAGSGTQAVSGPLTDAQLRASVVPVDSELTTSDLDSGGGTDTRAVVGVVIPGSGGGVLMSQPATDAQLRATPLPVSGTVTASGPLTDAQLAARLPLSVEQATSVDIADGGGSITVDAPVGTPVRVDPTGTTTQPVSGTVTASGPLTDTQLRATAPDVNTSDRDARLMGRAKLLDSAGAVIDPALKGQLPTALVSGRLSVDASAVAVPVTDNAGSLTVDSPGLPAALDGVSLKVKEQSPLTQPLTDAQLAARLPLSVEQATSVAATVDQASVTTGNITSGSGASSRVDTACTGYPVCSVSLSGTYNIPILQIEGSDDGGTTFPFALQYSTGFESPDFAAFAPTANTTYLFRVDTLGMTHLRVRASTYTSGTGAVRVTPTAGAYPVPGFQTVDTELGIAVTATTGMSPATYQGPVVVAQMMAHNQTGFDPWRANVDGNALTSSARTTTAGGTSADLVNYNGRGVQIAINVTNIVTACSIQANIQGKDVLSGVYYKLAADPTAITATGLYVYEFYPGASTAAAGGITVRVAASVPRTWRVIVTHNNANAITYSVGYSCIL